MAAQAPCLKIKIIGFPGEPEKIPKALEIGQERYVDLKNFFDKKIKNGKICETATCLYALYTCTIQIPIFILH